MGYTRKNVAGCGGLTGRVILAVLLLSVASRRRLIRLFQVPGLVLFPLVYLYLFREAPDLFVPAYFFCGHIHEAEGKVIQLGRTRAQNVGKAGYLLELD